MLQLFVLKLIHGAYLKSHGAFPIIHGAIPADVKLRRRGLLQSDFDGILLGSIAAQTTKNDDNFTL